jgi:predicted DNA-binding transcriptional regulator AlpA
MPNIGVLMNMRQITEALGFKSRHGTYALMASDPAFPKPRRFNRRVMRWHRRDIDEYLALRPMTVVMEGTNVDDLL